MGMGRMATWALLAASLSISATFVGVVGGSSASATTAAGSSSSSTASQQSFAARKACRLLQQRFPQQVAFPGSQQFEQNIEHWAESSEQNATCSIEPETPEDVSNILQIIGRTDIRSPFAVKSGGHAYNVGFSSTTGIQISLRRFDQVTVDARRGTATLGTGLTWDQVYGRLEPFGVMVAGGRIPGIGVGGFSLGGGYSWKTNQVGLTVDTIVGFDLVLPTGKAVQVTSKSNPDLFFALKGGLNNFGIVTSITFQTHPQTQIYGGMIAFSGDVLNLVHSATEDFDLNNEDPKAQIIVSYASISGQLLASVFLFYDGPEPPLGTFDKFMAIPAMATQLSTQSFSNFMNTTFQGGDLGIGPMNIAQHVIPIVKYTQPVLEEMINQINIASSTLSARTNGSLVIVSIAPEPFLNPNAHSQGGAFPHPTSRQVTPASPFIVYPASLPFDRSIFSDALKTMCHNVQAKAVEVGQSRWDDLLYPNYALADTPLEAMYGSNVARLKQIARRIDPQRVMQLTGGFKFGN